jgi:hypothetical protein
MIHIWEPSIPLSFLDGSNTLISSTLPQFEAYLEAGAVKFNSKLNNTCTTTSPSVCFQLDYLAFNGPDLGPKINSADYNTIVKDLNAFLTANNLPTKIIGPGPSHLDGKKNFLGAWVAGTDPITLNVVGDAAATAAHGMWGINTYIWGKSGSSYWEDIEASSSINGQGQTSMRFFYPAWYTNNSSSPSPAIASPSKPTFATEFQSHVLKFHGVAYPHSANSATVANCAQGQNANIAGDCSVILTVPYGVRMYTNAIALLASGISGEIYWEGQDQSWESSDTGWGLIDLNGAYKPIYYALLPLFNIPTSATTVLVSPSSQAGNDIYSVGFKYANPSNAAQTCVTMALANGTAKSTGKLFTRTTKLTGLGTMALQSVTTSMFSQATGTGSSVYTYQVTNPSVTVNNLGSGQFSFITTTDPNKASTPGYTYMPQDSALTVQACFQ